MLAQVLKELISPDRYLIFKDIAYMQFSKMFIRANAEFKAM